MSVRGRENSTTLLFFSKKSMSHFPLLNFHHVRYVSFYLIFSRKLTQRLGQIHVTGKMTYDFHKLLDGFCNLETTAHLWLDSTFSKTASASLCLSKKYEAHSIAGGQLTDIVSSHTNRRLNKNIDETAHNNASTFS